MNPSQPVSRRFIRTIACAILPALLLLAAHAQTFRVLHEWVGQKEGSNPKSAMIEGSDGRFYGNTGSGGAFGDGTLFALNSDGSGFTVLRHLKASTDGAFPSAGFVEGSDGRLYGATASGGTYYGGTIFALNPDGSGFTVLHHFTNGSSAALIEGSDGRLYGTTQFGGSYGSGTLFAINSDGSGFTVLRHLSHASDGGFPSSALVEGSDGRLYGTATSGGTYNSGTLFTINPDGSGFTVMRHLASATDGSAPSAALVEGSDGRLYGSTQYGGTASSGTLFAINSDGSGFTVLRHLASAIDGGSPSAALVEGSDGRLFGTTQYGGGNFGSGTLFALKPDGSEFTVLRHLKPTTDGVYPHASLVEGSDGRLFGTTELGGNYNAGTLFAINPAGSGFTVLHHLVRASDGSSPLAALVKGSDGRLYGTTSQGGTYGFGTLFALNSDGSGFTVLRHLAIATDGGYPWAALTKGSDGRLYGTSTIGGAHTSGTVFALNSDGSGFTVLRHLARATDGGDSYAELVVGSDGRLYGTARTGGSYGTGTLFVLNSDGTGFTVLRHLSHASDGGYPSAALVEGTDGRLYGTTQIGGNFSAGTLFAIGPDGSGFTVLRHLANATDGSPALYALVEGADSRLYGTTYQGGNLGSGTLFALNSDGSGFTVLRHLELATDGGEPYAALVVGSDGRFYGTASRGGTYGRGTLFVLSFVPEITSALTASGELGQAFNYTITANNAPDDFDALGLPTGLAVNNASGLISGAPQEMGAFPVVIAASNIHGTGYAELALTVTGDPALLPAIKTQPQDVTEVAGKNATFAVNAKSPTALSYQWLKNDAVIPNATDSQLILRKITDADEGSYRVRVSNEAGSVLSASATLTVLAPPVITAPPVSVSVAVGDSANFSVTVTGDEPLSYQWRKDKAPISGGTSPTLVLNNLQTTDAGKYDVVISNAAGSATSDNARLTVLK